MNKHPMIKTTDEDIPAALRRSTAIWPGVWTALTMGMLLIALIISWADAQMTWERRLLVLGLALLWAAWYRGFVFQAQRWRAHSTLHALGFALGMVLASILSWLHPAFLMIVFGYYGISFGVLSMRWAVGMMVLLSALLVARFIGFSGGLTSASIPLIASFSLSAFFAVLLGLYVDSIIRTSRERKQAIEELESTRNELAAAERQAGILAERQRLAGEIHDTLAQGFTSIVMNLEAADAALDGDPQVARDFINRARDTARDNLTEARRFVWALKPELLERRPFQQALGEVTARWQDESGVEVRLNTSGEQQPLSTDQEVTLLRAAQEALANIRKHAGASHVDVTLTWMEDEVFLDIQDNGHGFDPAGLSTNGESFGLGILRKRVEQLRGTLTIESAPGEGATIAIALPTGGMGGEESHE